MHAWDTFVIEGMTVTIGWIYKNILFWGLIGGVLIPDPAYCFGRFPYSAYCFVRFPYPAYTMQFYFFVIIRVPLDFISRFSLHNHLTFTCHACKKSAIRRDAYTQMRPTILLYFDSYKPHYKYIKKVA